MFGIGVTIICMTIVFLVLIGLSFIIRIQGALVGKRSGDQDKKAADNNRVVTDAVENEEDSEELIAVISAAVAAVMGRPSSNVIVRSIKRVGINTPSWALAGRQEQISGRF